MATFTIEEIADAMRDPELVRNFTIAANVDAGKSTFSDSMLCYAGLINKDQAGDKTAMDTMKIEQERGITIKSVGVSMLFNNHGKQYIMNMVDSPGHIDFSAEVTAAVRVSDGVFVLLDPVDGVMAQTRTVLSQALTERVVPCLMINKVDKLFLSLQATPDEIYNIFIQNIVDVNNEIDINQDPDMVTITRDQKVDPIRGNVMFSSAYHTWGFTLKTFAKIYESKMPGMSIESIMKKLWQRENFCNMIIKPIYTVLKACNAWPEPIPDDKDKNLKSVIGKLGISLKPQDFDLRGKALIRKVMGAWLPIAPTAVEMAAEHLPSPKTAQAYRAKLLYTGGEDEYLQSIRECNPNGPLIMYISKMIPSQGGARFSAFGRVFSGTVRSGKVKVLLPNHDPSAEVTSSQKTFVNASVQKVVLMMASRIETIDSVPAGNIMALDGVDNAMVKSGTIVDENAESCHRLQNMDFSVAPIVRYSLVLNNPAQLPKFTETLKKYVKSDPCLLYVLTEEGEHLLCGSGELHLETAIEILRSDYMPDGITFRVSEPIVSYCETVTTPSTMTCLSKSPNKHNRLFCTAQPLEEALVNEMIGNTLPKEPKERARHLIDTYGFDESARKIWKMAPEINPCNMVIDCTKGVQYMNEIKDSVASGFLHGVDKGPLCDEPLRGVRLNLEDVTLHADAIHRGGGQIIPTMRSVLFASVLTANPRLLEPVFKAEIQLPREKTSSIYGLMSQRRGEVKNVEDLASGSRTKVEATLPVADSFGFVEELRGVTSGTAFVSLCFSHWQVVPGNPLEVGTYAYDVVMKIRKRKDLKLELPKLENYNDKL